MNGTNRFALRACATAVAAAFSLQAFAQSSLEHALGNNRDAITTYNQIQAGLDRSGRAPLETVWLRAEALEELWEKNPALSQTFQGCGKAGTPKEGCMVSGRTFWRFTLAPSLNAFAPSLSAQALRAAPPEADAAPAAGGVYLVANAGAIGQRGGAVLLAAGATAQLIDTAYPSVLIEVSAPKDEPLLLGNLAASDIGKALAILTRQPGGSANVASLGNGGRVALHRNSPAPLQVASVARNPVVLAAPRLDDWTGGELPQPIHVAIVEPRLDDWTGGELPQPIQVALTEPRLDDWTGGALPQPVQVALAEPRLDDWTGGALPQPVQVALAEPRLDDWTGGELPQPVQVALAEPRLDDWTGGALPQPIQVALAEPRLDDWTGGALPQPVQVALAEPRLDDWTGGELPQPVQVALAEPRLDDWTGGELATILTTTVALVEAAPEKPVIAAKPIVLAVTAPPASATNADVARMRAEVEAEVARERERLAQQVQSRGTKRFSFGT
ncbi:MAG TPA: hypothetical protein VD965_05735 [Burkholderiales bacterium]|nr:hypothetical protein [Burkholderiales bacterium]